MFRPRIACTKFRWIGATSHSREPNLLPDRVLLGWETRNLQAATVRLGHLIFQTKQWNEAIRMADLKGAVAIARHYHAGSVRADDIKATAF
jgi:hypothetical protein